ncbi:hypothetical protein ACED96_07695 [Clostridium thermobutyricum]|uniref:Uncharacterized protein n=1 Tax=Clostridium thermobutyricum DSM 4928 TaxID=1121339 RepID=A0A1V4SXF2_9CLOT|nr:hypothetical protein [Clostridium thermobutyricum]OPX48028.1 hypothetical protein CLTHE_16000 [Clostridium thermobutyricum DSM 4928]
MENMKVFNKKIHWDGLNLSCVMERYLDTNNLALELYDEDGEFYECVTLDYRESLPKINNAIINNREHYEGILNVLTAASLVRVVGKIDVKMIMRDLVVVNSRAFIEIDEDTFQEFAKSSYNDLNEFLTKADEPSEVEEI